MMSYLQSAKNHWQLRPPKEKMILLAIGSLIIVGLSYLLLADPLINWKKSEQKKFAANQQMYSQVTRLVNQFKHQQSPGKQVTSNLAVTIDTSLRDNDLSMQSFKPGKNNDARLRLNNVAYAPLVQWLYDIEYHHAVIIEELFISQTNKNGLLMATIRVRQKPFID